MITLHLIVKFGYNWFSRFVLNEVTDKHTNIYNNTENYTILSSTWVKRKIDICTGTRICIRIKN